MELTYEKDQLIQETILFTAKMGADYPELYTHLSETPLFLTEGSGSEIRTADFESYLDTIKRQTLKYIETHSK